MGIFSSDKEMQEVTMLRERVLLKKFLGVGIATLLSLIVASTANAVVIDFTGGTVFLNNGTSFVTNNVATYQNVSRYEEGGFRLEFIF